MTDPIYPARDWGWARAGSWVGLPPCAVTCETGLRLTERMVALGGKLLLTSQPQHTPNHHDTEKHWNTVWEIHTRTERLTENPIAGWAGYEAVVNGGRREDRVRTNPPRFVLEWVRNPIRNGGVVTPPTTEQNPRLKQTVPPRTHPRFPSLSWPNRPHRVSGVVSQRRDVENRSSHRLCDCENSGRNYQIAYGGETGRKTGEKLASICADTTGRPPLSVGPRSRTDACGRSSRVVLVRSQPDREWPTYAAPSPREIYPVFRESRGGRYPGVSKRPHPKIDPAVTVLFW